MARPPTPVSTMRRAGCSQKKNRNPCVCFSQASATTLKLAGCTVIPTSTRRKDAPNAAPPPRAARRRRPGAQVARQAALSIFCSNSFRQKIIPPRGPRRVLCVVVVTTSA